MATSSWSSVLRPGESIARAILPGGRSVAVTPAHPVETLRGDGSTAMYGRPSLAFGLLTALVGCVLAIWQARSSPRRQTLRHRLRHARGRFRAALDLPPLAIKLLANPIVQDYLRRKVLSEVSRSLRRQRPGLTALLVDSALGRLRSGRSAGVTKRS